MTDAKIQRFAPGDRVPEWLMTAEPLHAHSIRGRMTFSSRVDVAEFEDCFVVLPMDEAVDGLISFSGGGCKIFASSKAVHLCVGVQTLYPENINAARLPTTELFIKSTSFWQKLKDLFS